MAATTAPERTTLKLKVDAPAVTALLEEAGAADEEPEPELPEEAIGVEAGEAAAGVPALAPAAAGAGVPAGPAAAGAEVAA